MCGVIVTCGCAHSALVAGSGSVGKTSSVAPSLTFAGEWGLYDLFVRGGGPGARTGANQYQLSWKVGPSSVRATLTPSTSGSDPFDLELFKLRAPQSVTP